MLGKEVDSSVVVAASDDPSSTSLPCAGMVGEADSSSAILLSTVSASASAAESRVADLGGGHDSC